MADDPGRAPQSFPFAPPPDAAPEAPRQVGPYRLVRLLASGGMGSVWLGRDDALHRDVAVKLMAPELAADPDAVARFQREARAAASIRHKNVAMIYMVGLADEGTPFLAMEHIPGGSLESLIRDRRAVPLSTIAGWMIECCAALRAAQREGVIHRDIKPGNIMLGSEGQAKVVDFGLAKFMNDQSFRTQAGTVMGTPRYMSPEQAQGREVDYRSDMYSLAAAFYHVLAGRAPFDGETQMQVMMKHITSPLPPIRSLNPEVPMEFDDAIRKAMAKDPNERYLDYEDFAADLHRIQLQCATRENGSIVGAPIAAAAASGGSGRFLSEEEVEPEQKTPPWAIAVMGGAGALVVAGLLFLVVSALFPGEKPAREPNPELQGLRALFEALSAASQASSGAGSAAHSEDWIRYEATQRILAEFGSGMLAYEVENGRLAPDLATLAASGAVVRIFDTDSRGRPLDAWLQRLEYLRDEQQILSPGLDGTPFTDDDLIVGNDGIVRVQDELPYIAVMFDPGAASAPQQRATQTMRETIRVERGY